MATKTKWLGAFSQSDERDTVNAGEKQTLNSTIKILEDAGNTIVNIIKYQGGVLILYTTP